MKTITVYEVHISDGGGGSRRGFYLKTKEAAEEWLARNNWDSFYEKKIVIFDDLEDYEQNSYEGLKKKAMAKLTTEEKELLGLK